MLHLVWHNHLVSVFFGFIRMSRRVMEISIVLGGAEFVNLVRCLILEIKECFGIPQQQMS